MSSCLLDEEHFRLCCQLLLQQSDLLRDGWRWEAVQGSEEGYLRKTTLRSVVMKSRSDWDQEGSSPASETQTLHHAGSGQDKKLFAVSGSGDAGDIITGEAHDDEDEDDDGVCEASEGSSQVLQYEFHVLYSCSYGTPVLYFRVFTLEGRSLSLEEVWSSVHPHYRLPLLQDPFRTITQQEHPLLGQPFFLLHPCRTEEFMRPVLQAAQQERRSVNYVLTWLSVVAPVVGLDVPLSYSFHVHGGDAGSTQPG